MSALFSPLKIRELQVKNRIFMSPMCQYSAENGLANSWHLVHLGSRAVGGSSLIMTEATAVSPEGRISPGDLGIWSEKQAEALRPITTFIRQNGAVAAIQIAHAGRKASSAPPWKGGQSLSSSEGGWTPMAPSAVPFSPQHPVPYELSATEILDIIDQFKRAARLSLAAGFEVVEIHMAHGYLLHEFLSPLSNHRQDLYGGSFENRIRLPLQIAKEIRMIWPESRPIFVRISTSDWSENGWDLEQSVRFCQELKKVGVDLIDCSSGGLVPHARIPSEPGYQVPFSETIRKETGFLTGAVGLITEATQAESILMEGRADAIFLGRELLRNPYWPLDAAKELDVQIEWPNPYVRAKTQKKDYR